MKQKRKYSQKTLREATQGYTFMAPTIFVLALFIIGPILYAFFLSFHKVQLLGTTSYQFVGIDLVPLLFLLFLVPYQ